MRSTLVYALVAICSATTVLAQRGHGEGGGSGGGFFNHGGGNAPTTLITQTSAAPAATATATESSGGSTTGSTSSSAGSSSVDASLIPPFGITAGVKASDGTANCAGDNNVDIPCTCPPALDTFVTDVEKFVAGGLSFPSGTSAQDQLTRLQTCIVTLQNFVGGAGSGVGCPIVSTTWKELQAQLEAEV